MKRIFLTLTVIAAALTSNAQSIGARAGVNFSNIIKTGDDDFKTEFKPGVHAGLTLDIPIVRDLSLSPEIMFSQKGYKTTRTGILGGESEYSVTTNFIDVPVLLKFGAGSGFNLHLGPQISFLTSTTTSFKTGSEEYRNRVNEQNENLKKNLIGGVIGAGFSVGPRASLVARYAVDFKKNDESGSEVPEYKNQVIQVGLGLKF